MKAMGLVQSKWATGSSHTWSKMFEDTFSRDAAQVMPEGRQVNFA